MATRLFTRGPPTHPPAPRCGAKLPQQGYGCWKLAKDTAAQNVFDAIKSGYRHIDSACDYGNEVQVGQGIARAIAEGVCTRAELWVTSKLWCSFHRPEHVVRQWGGGAAARARRTSSRADACAHPAPPRPRRRRARGRSLT